jgi:hypothetical protein
MSNQLAFAEALRRCFLHSAVSVLRWMPLLHPAKMDASAHCAPYGPNDHAQKLTGRFATIATPPGTGSTSQFGVKLWLAISMRGSSAAGAWGPATLNALLDTTASAQPVRRKQTAAGRQRQAAVSTSTLANAPTLRALTSSSAAGAWTPATLNAPLDATASAQPVRPRQQTCIYQQAGSGRQQSAQAPCAAQNLCDARSQQPV